MMVVVMMIPAIVVIVIAVRAVMMMVMMPPTVMVIIAVICAGSSRMSAMGQIEKNSVRVYVFRFALELGHCSTLSHVSKVPTATSRCYSIASPARAMTRTGERCRRLAVGCERLLHGIR